MPSEPNLPAGLALSLAAALLSALGMNLQAAQALIEQAAVAEKGAWRTKLGRAWSSDRLTTQENDRLETDRVDGDGDRVTVDSPASPTSITSNERTALIRSSSSRWPIPSPIEEAEFLASPAPLPHGTRLFKRLLGRTMWHAGLAIYLIGAAGLSTYALEFIPPVLAAPLSSASLVFNLGLARWMLGTRITLLDGLGTFLLLLGSTLCSVFSHPDPPLSPDSISRLFTSPAFLGLFLGQLVPALILFFSLVTAESMQPHGILHRHLWVPWLAPKIEQSGAVSWLETEDGWLLPGIEAASEKNGTQTRRIGMGFATIGGLIASLSLLLTKTSLALIPHLPMHLTGPLLIAPIMLPFLLAIQLYALNRSLDLAPPLLSVPLFFAGFTGPQLPDQIVMNLVATGQSGYEAWELGVLGVGVAVVLLGVGVLAGGGAKDDPVRLD